MRGSRFAIIWLLFIFLFAGCSNTPPTAPTADAAATTEAQAKPPVKLGMLKADFPEPFVPTVRDADDTAFAAVLKQYKTDTRPKAEKVELLEAYLREHPDDPWSPSIALNLGLYQYERGSFSRAVSHLSTAWEKLDQAEDPRVKPLADRALGEYAIKLAQFGRYEELRPLLKQTEGRTLQGSATEWIAAAREGLLAMDEKPEISFLCGPYALAWVGETSDSWNDKSREIPVLLVREL